MTTKEWRHKIDRRLNEKNRSVREVKREYKIKRIIPNRYRTIGIFICFYIIDSPQLLQYYIYIVYIIYHTILLVFSLYQCTTYCTYRTCNRAFLNFYVLFWYLSLICILYGPMDWEYVRGLGIITPKYFAFHHFFTHYVINISCCYCTTSLYHITKNPLSPSLSYIYIYIYIYIHTYYLHTSRVPVPCSFFLCIIIPSLTKV